VATSGKGGGHEEVPVYGRADCLCPEASRRGQVTWMVDFIISLAI